MVSMMRSFRLATGIGMAFFAMACAQSPPSATADGTWSGQDSQHQYDFNAPLNWMPRGVPTGTAIIPAEQPPVPFIQFTEPVTALGAIRLTGNLGFTIDPGRSVSVLSGGLTICCKGAAAHINGELTGNVTLGEVTGQNSHQVTGAGTIKGNIHQSGGSVVPGNGPGSLLTVVGTYNLASQAALIIDAYPDSSTRLDVRGTATLSGVLLIYLDDPTKILSGPFKILSAGGGVQGKFRQVTVVNAPVKAEALYDRPNEVWVSLSK